MKTPKRPLVISLTLGVIAGVVAVSTLQHKEAELGSLSLSLRNEWDTSVTTDRTMITAANLFSGERSPVPRVKERRMLPVHRGGEMIHEMLDSLEAGQKSIDLLVQPKGR